MSEGAVAEPVRTEPAGTEPARSEPARAESESDQAWRVYGIVPAEAELPELSSIDIWQPDQDPSGESADSYGIGELRPQLVRNGPIAAVVEPIDPNRKVRRRDLVTHSAVVNALAARGPVIPIAFGSAFHDRDQVVDGLLAAPGTAEALAQRLEELRDHAQFQIRIQYLMDDLLARIVAADSEISVLRERTRDLPEPESYHDRVRLGELVSNAVERRLTEDSEELINALGAEATAAEVSARSDSTPSVSLAFLVADADRQRFEAAAERAAENLRDLAVVELLGPLAPFDFVSDLEPRS